MKKNFALAALLAALFLNSQAQAHEAHQHGAARLDVAVEGTQVRIDLESPLDNALGFEHAPGNEAQRKAVRDMAATLRRAEEIFLFPKAAQCRPVSVALHSGKLDPALLDGSRAAASAKPAEGHAHGHGGHQKEAAAAQDAKHAAAHSEQGHEEHGEHGDLDAAFVFDCARPEALHSLDVRLFTVWPGLRELAVQMVTPKGQQAGELTPARHRLQW